MNAVLENIFSRRSIRSFKPQPIPREDLELIMKAAIHAPTGMNIQNWQFTVVLDSAKMQSLARVIAAELGLAESYNFNNPAALVLVSTPAGAKNGIADCSCALENIFLAANSLGIGSYWINQLKDICDKPDIRAELDKLGLPYNHLVWGMAALGYEAAPPKPIERNAAAIKWVE